MKSILLTFLSTLACTILQAQTILDSAVNFTVKDVHGITHRLHEYLEQDKIVVIDFFTITCGPCTTYAPLINESFNHFGCNTSNVVFLGINWGGDNAGVIDFGITYGIQYPEISGTEGNGNHVVADYGILSYPTVVLILPDYYIAEKYIWPPSTGHLDSTIIAHGGIISDCNTAVGANKEVLSGNNRIVSVYPMPAKTLLSITTSVQSLSSIEICSLSGRIVTDQIPVAPGEKIEIATNNLQNGCYILILRNGDLNILDRRLIVIQ